MKYDCLEYFFYNINPLSATSIEPHVPGQDGVLFTELLMASLQIVALLSKFKLT